MFNSNLFGKNAEQKAVKFLKKAGLKIVEQNFYSRFGEIDIIAKSDNLLHFIEVKATARDYDALYRITPQKMEKIIKTVNYYCIKNELNCDYQIDAIIINSDKIEWIKNIDY